MSDLSLDDIESILLEPESKTPKLDALKRRYPTPPQRGPLRFVESNLICTKKGCRVQTQMKVDGIPRCHTHALHELNDLAIKLTDRIEELVKR